ncbi:MAG: hypothetical protein IH631_09465, partial [Candidatus Thorarchaeota archaeon]|nr:hypothetical protein [Candidatus Thorarchaeota archaeon]
IYSIWKSDLLGGGANLTGKSYSVRVVTMTAPVIFNRRFSKSELNAMIELLENQTECGYLDRDRATSFLNLQDTMSFVSSVKDEIIGGTIIYRDRTRQGMILASVAVRNEFRETSAYSVIKSSLPFFKTVAIRDVEALIPENHSEERLGFPGSLELDYWTKDILGRIGFEHKDTLYAYTIEIPDSVQMGRVENQWDANPVLEKAKSLIWDSCKTAGLTNSYLWTAFDFATNQDTLRTMTFDDSMKLISSIYIVGTSSIIGLIIADDDFIESGLVSRQIAQLVRETRTRKLILPLIGKGQTDLIKEIVDELGGFHKRRSMTLMCKNM